MSGPDLTVIEALKLVMSDVQSVGKTGRNTHQNYSFRGVDAVVNAVGPALRVRGVVCLPNKAVTAYREVEVGQNRTLQRECTLTITYRFYGPAGDHVDAEVASEALDSGDKATSKAFSVAYRTLWLQALTIPTNEPDPDESSPERSPRQQPEDRRAAAWRRINHAIAQGVPDDVAAKIQTALGADLDTMEGAEAVADAIEKFAATGELPVQPTGEELWGPRTATTKEAE